MLSGWEQFSDLIGMAVLLAHIAIALYVVFRLILKKPWSAGVTSILRKYGLLCAALVGVGATLGSLFISYGFGIPACDLCWFQRTMIYPLAIITLVAWWRSDVEVWRYVVPLASIGALVGLYQHVMQVWPSLGLACGSTTASASCAVRYLFEFGYITLPLLGVTTCVLIAIFVWEARKASR